MWKNLVEQVRPQITKYGAEEDALFMLRTYQNPCTKVCRLLVHKLMLVMIYKTEENVLITKYQGMPISSHVTAITIQNDPLCPASFRETCQCLKFPLYGLWAQSRVSPVIGLLPLAPWTGRFRDRLHNKYKNYKEI
jgi:hypothetical protein